MAILGYRNVWTMSTVGAVDLATTVVAAQTEEDEMTTRSLAEEFLLLALDDSTGKPLVDSTKMKAAIAGATLVELTMTGALRLTGHDEAEFKEGRLVRTGQGEPTDPLLREVLATAHDRTPKSAVSRIGGASAWRNRAGDLKDALLLELASEGVLHPEKAKVLGLFPTTTWKPENPQAEAEVAQRVQQVVVQGQQPDQRTAALVSLLSVVDLLPKLFPEQDKKALRERGKQVSQGNWGGEAVKKAIEEVNASVIAAVVASTAATSASTSG